MTSCCAKVAAPQVQVYSLDSLLDGCSNVSDKDMRDEMIDTQACIIPVTPLKDIRSQLSALRDHQEKMFRELIDQQTDIQGHMLAIRSDCKASMDSQASLEQRQEFLIMEFQNSNRSRRVSFSEDPAKAAKAAEKMITAEKASKLSDKIMTECGMELVGDCCLPTEPDEVKFSKGDPESSQSVEEGALSRSISNFSQASWSKRKRSMKKINVHSFDGHSQGSTDGKGRLDRLLVSKEFELVVAGAIMVNAFVMCWECQYKGLDVGFHLQYPGRHTEANNVWSGASSAFTVLDWIFGSLFVLEMVAKLGCWRCRYFFDSEGLDWDLENFETTGWKRVVCMSFRSVQGWNIADLSLVLTFIFDKAATAFGKVNPRMLRLLRLVRLFRLVRLLRFLESLDHLYIMTTAISGLNKVLTWAVVLLTTMLTICDLFLVHMLHETYFNNVSVADLNEVQLERHHRMYEYFGTFTRCMLSMFEITLGNWPPVARLLSEEVSEWFTLICLVHKLTIGFSVIGVITGVILQETFKVAQTDDLIMFRQKKLASRTLRHKMRMLFEALDRDFDGRLCLDEFKAIGNFPEIQCWLSSLGVETDDLSILFSLLDVDNDGSITLEELVERMPRVAGNAKGVDLLALSRRFPRSWKMQ